MSQKKTSGNLLPDYYLISHCIFTRVPEKKMFFVYSFNIETESLNVIAEVDNIRGYIELGFYILNFWIHQIILYEHFFKNLLCLQFNKIQIVFFEYYVILSQCTTNSLRRM